jgi:hypothetical protein
MAPQLDAAQHILIEALLKEGFETKLIASEASCSVQRARRLENPSKETAVRNAHPKRMWGYHRPGSPGCRTCHGHRGETEGTGTLED